MRNLIQGTFVSLLICWCGTVADARPQPEEAKPATAEKRAPAKKAEAKEKDAEIAAKKAAEKKKQAAKRKAAALQIRLAANPQINLQNQFRPKFEQLLQIELAFVRRICDLDEQQCRTLSQEAAKFFDEMVKKYAAAHGPQFRGGVQLGRNGRSRSDPRIWLQDEILKLLKEHLSAEHAERYQSEITAREESHKQATAEFLVAKLDERMVLSEKQREQLTQSLKKDWQDNWEQTIRYMMNSNHYFPNIPDQTVSRFLDKNQKAVWRGMQKVSFGHNEHQGFEVGKLVVDDFEIIKPGEHDTDAAHTGEDRANGGD